MGLIILPGESERNFVRCQIKGCDQCARWKPELIFPDGECDRICAGRCKFDMYVCTKHKYELEVKDFLSDYNWWKYQGIIRKNGHHPPERKDVRLDWIEEAQAGDPSGRRIMV